MERAWSERDGRSRPRAWREQVELIDNDSRSHAEAARLASFPERDPNPIVELDRSLQPSYVNPAAAVLFPALSGQGAGHPWLAGLEEMMVELERRPAVSGTREIRVGDRHYEQVVQLLPDIGSVRVYGKDITARKEADLAVLRAQKLETVGVLAGGIAHDFNNLLTGIFGFLELAQACAAPGSEVRGRLEQSMAVFERARALTKRLLSFANGGAPTKQIVGLKPVIRSAVAFALSGASTTARFDLDEDLWPCAVDSQQLTQALENIVLNARQAMPDGSCVFIEARNRDRGKNAAAESTREVEIVIRDTGTGIAPERLEHIFDAFCSTKEGGTGLGMPLADRIVRSHGGRIEVASELGRGTTFRIVLPASNQTVAPPPPAKDMPAPGRPARILLMDDEESVRDMLSTMLSRLGHTVEPAREGGEAVAAYRQAMKAGQPFDVVILDLTVRGGMGGNVGMGEILKIDPLAKGIVSSGYVEDPVLLAPSDHGFCGHLGKPYTMGELMRLLHDALSGTAAARP